MQEIFLTTVKLHRIAITRPKLFWACQSRFMGNFHAWQPWWWSQAKNRRWLAKNVAKSLSVLFIVCAKNISRYFYSCAAEICHYIVLHYLLVQELRTWEAISHLVSVFKKRLRVCFKTRSFFSECQNRAFSEVWRFSHFLVASTKFRVWFWPELVQR